MASIVERNEMEYTEIQLLYPGGQTGSMYFMQAKIRICGIARGVERTGARKKTWAGKSLAEQESAHGARAGSTALSKEQILVCGTNGFPNFEAGSEMANGMINVEVDDEFRIPLKTIATAGYVWKIDALPDSIQLLETENEKRRDDARPGDPNNQFFRFQVYNQVYSFSAMGKQSN
jgi:predicted secreted protein